MMTEEENKRKVINGQSCRIPEERNNLNRGNRKKKEG